MCTGKEIYCQDNRCRRLVGWHILEPCGESKFCDFPSQHASSDGDLSWGAFHYCCNELRIIQRQRSKYRICAYCVRRLMDLMATNLKTWAEGAREESERLEETVTDHLMLRRRKRASRDEGGREERKQESAPTIDFEPVFNFDINEWPASNNNGSGSALTFTNPFDPSSMSTLGVYFDGPSTYHVTTLDSDQQDSMVYQGRLNFEDFLTEGLESQLASSQEVEIKASEEIPILQHEQNEAVTVASPRDEILLPADDFQASVLEFDENLWNTIVPPGGDCVSDFQDTGLEDGDLMYPPTG
ncbi:hypothetical protein PT974_08782 [Cladobotryum mycophilum]|uniref:Uncharacterized protein n=1 Tax=Cladobotryum mycophilum TaxID=491253 RepID=A0ABR0SEW5_9HYPO